jgi:hypothetical protein
LVFQNVGSAREMSPKTPRKPMSGCARFSPLVPTFSSICPLDVVFPVSFFAPQSGRKPKPTLLAHELQQPRNKLPWVEGDAPRGSRAPRTAPSQLAHFSRRAFSGGPFQCLSCARRLRPFPCTSSPNCDDLLPAVPPMGAGSPRDPGMARVVPESGPCDGLGERR